MNPNQQAQSARAGFRTGEVVALILLFTFVVAVVGVTSYFRLSSEAATLRESALSSLNVPWNRKINLNVGFFTTGLVRVGSHFINLPPEARAAIASVRGAEVGVYNLGRTAGHWDGGSILARADEAMAARCWDRLVGVSRKEELVAVYVPRRGLSSSRVRCCVLVLNRENLIVAGGSGNLLPLLQIAHEKMDLKDSTPHFALR